MGAAASTGPTGADGPHAFVADLADPVLDGADRHHLARVLRLRPSDTLTVSDGAGGWRPCRLGEGALEVVGDVVRVPRAEPAITVAFALVKGEKPEWVVQKATELGADHIRPFVAARSVVRWDERKAGAALGRLERVARGAAMQCRRCHLPVVHPVAGFAEVAGLPGAVLADRDGPAPSLGSPTVLVGPEGGWSPEERGAGVPVVGLGPHVLRADTAAITAVALLAAARAGLVVAPARGADDHA